MSKAHTEMDQAAKNLKRISDVKAKYEAELLKKANVVAVGIGLPIRDGRPAGEVGIMVSVTQKIDAEKLAARDLVPSELDEVRVWIIEVGQVHADNDTVPGKDA